MLLSVYNKWMFSKEHFGFPAPLFVTAMHMFIQFLLAAALRYAQPKTFRPAHNPTIGNYTYVFVISDSGVSCPPIFYRKKAVPTAVASGLDIGLSNLSLKTIPLSFYSEFLVDCDNNLSSCSDSNVQIVVTNIRVGVRVSFPIRSFLLASSCGYLANFCWGSPNGSY